MKPTEIKKRLAEIRRERDPNLKNLKLAGLVTAQFAERGYQLIVVGGSAIEFYTDGQYVSGDVDLCWLGKMPPLRERQEIMAKLDAEGGPRSWKVAGAFVDLLGEIETMAKTDFQILKSPYGEITLTQPEELIVERVLMAHYPRRNEEAENAAKKMLAVGLGGKAAINWSEVERLAKSPAYRVESELVKLKQEVQEAMAK